jgi:hypothetical protein
MSNNSINELENYFKLYKAGEISKEEYEHLKSKVIGHPKTKTTEINKGITPKKTPSEEEDDSFKREEYKLVSEKPTHPKPSAIPKRKPSVINILAYVLLSVAVLAIIAVSFSENLGSLFKEERVKEQPEEKIEGNLQFWRNKTGTYKFCEQLCSYFMVTIENDELRIKHKNNYIRNESKSKYLEIKSIDKNKIIFNQEVGDYNYTILELVMDNSSIVAKSSTIIRGEKSTSELTYQLEGKDKSAKEPDLVRRLKSTALNEIKKRNANFWNNGDLSKVTYAEEVERMAKSIGLTQYSVKHSVKNGSGSNKIIKTVISDSGGAVWDFVLEYNPNTSNFTLIYSNESGSF